MLKTKRARPKINIVNVDPGPAISGVGFCSAAISSPCPEHKTYFLSGTTSASTDDLAPASEKRIRLYGFYGFLQVDAAYNPSVMGHLAFGTGGLTDKSKILAVHGNLAGARTLVYCMSPMNRLGAVDEVIRFTMPTFAAGVAQANFILAYVEES